MFTGIIKDLGIIKEIKKNQEGLQIEICTQLINEISVDDSVAINGVCQTVIKKSEKSFIVQAISTTLLKTTFKNFIPNQYVNLELALQFTTRVGGHFVQGHINGIASVQKIVEIGKAKKIELQFPEEMGKYLIMEGSVALDGVSLTISNLNYDKCQLEVSLIPHSLLKTTANLWKLGSEVNIEVDLLAKYVENLLFYSLQRKNLQKEPLSMELLNKFLKD